VIKHLGNGFLLLVMLCSLGCTTTQDDNAYIGWHCSGDKRSDDWACEQRKVKNGQATDGSIQQIKTASAVGENGEPKKGKFVYAGIPNQSWRKQLPTLTNAQVMTGIPGKRPSNLKALPPRQSEPVSSAVVAYPLASDSDSITVGESAPTDEATVAPIPVAPVTVTPINDPVIDQGPVTPSPLPGFTLQLVAFKTQEQLQSFISDNRLDKLSVSQAEVLSGGGTWHVLTWGEFETRAKALQAWEQQGVNYPKIEPWARSLSTLKIVRSQEEVDTTQES
jgi:septal ring-binding cell division protein DamX